MVGVDSCIAWLYEELKVGGEARSGKTLPVPAHRPHQGPTWPVCATLTLTTYDNPNPTRNGLCP